MLLLLSLHLQPCLDASSQASPELPSPAQWSPCLCPTPAAARPDVQAHRGLGMLQSGEGKYAKGQASPVLSTWTPRGILHLGDTENRPLLQSLGLGGTPWTLGGTHLAHICKAAPTWMENYTHTGLCAQSMHQSQEGPWGSCISKRSCVYTCPPPHHPLPRIFTNTAAPGGLRPSLPDRPPPG